MANEKRLIDANATIDVLRRIGSRDYRREKGTIADAIKMLSHPAYTPTVDAVEVVHGRYHRKHIGNGWNDWDALTCSVCGEYYEKPDFPENYCPNCGAKMDGGKGNEKCI